MSKRFALAVIFLALSALVVFPYLLSSERVARIACLANQEKMLDALVSFQADNAGTTPQRMSAFMRYYKDPPQNFACCPGSFEPYSYDPSTGRVTCPNPSHRNHP